MRRKYALAVIPVAVMVTTGTMAMVEQSNAESSSAGCALSAKQIVRRSGATGQLQQMVVATDSGCLEQALGGTGAVSYYSPSLSPDGEHIALVSSDFSQPGSGYVLQIWEPSTGELVPVQTSATPITNPSWHPSGDAVVYATESDNSTEISQTSISSGLTTELVPDTDVSVRPVWASDGDSFAYVVAGSDFDNVVVAAPDGSPLREIGVPGVNFNKVAFDPEGESLLAAATDGEDNLIATIDLDNGKVVERAVVEDDVLDIGWVADSPRIVTSGDTTNSTSLATLDDNLDETGTRQKFGVPTLPDFEMAD